MDTIEILMQVVGAVVVASGAVVGIAHWIFKLFTEKWLTAKFAERLEDYKHEQQKELERVRFEINKLMDRSVKLHQREYDTLPEAWALLVNAFQLTKTAISSLQQYPDVERMNEAQLDDYLSTSILKDWQIAELKSARDKNKYLQNVLNWDRYYTAREATQKFHVFRLQHGIFLLPEIYEKLELIDDIIFEAIIEREVRLQGHSHAGQDEHRQRLLLEGDQIIKELSTSIRERLWS